MGLADVKAALEPPELTRDLGEKSRRSLHETNVVERRKSRRKALRALFVFSLNMVLGIIAGIIYSAAELPSEKASRLNAARLAKQLHGRLSPEDFAHALQTFGVDNATLFEDIAAMEAGTMDDLSYNWGYSGAMFFAFTVATSIGYGSFGGPITSGGRFFTIVYAVIAIPLMLVSFTKLCSALLTMLAQRLAGKKQDLPNKVFRIVDKDASGFLSKRECIDALRTLGLGHFAGAGATVEKHRRFEAAWEVIDPNTMESPAAGQIEVTQFTRLLKILMPHEDHYELFVDLITRGYIAVVAVGTNSRRSNLSTELDCHAVAHAMILACHALRMRLTPRYAMQASLSRFASCPRAFSSTSSATRTGACSTRSTSPS